MKTCSITAYDFKWSNSLYNHIFILEEYKLKKLSIIYSKTNKKGVPWAFNKFIERANSIVT